MVDCRFNYYSNLPVVDTHIGRIKKKSIGKGLAGHEKQGSKNISIYISNLLD
ncbi:MAG: hypothetical protein WBM02_08825 [bacterium]